MKKNRLLAILLFLFSPLKTLAFCPVCAVAVGGGVGISRWLGLDDLISGIWVGGLIISMSYWFIGWLEKKKISFPFMKPAVFILFYLITILPLYGMGIVGRSFNKICGIDRLVAGVVAGSLVFEIAIRAHYFYKEKNGGRVYFQFQKVIFVIASLTVLSIVFSFFC